MASISYGGITIIGANKNGCAPLNPLTLTAGTTLVFNHGLGTKNGTGKGAWKVRALNTDGADLIAIGGLQVIQPGAVQPDGSLLFDIIEITNGSGTDAVIVIEITWEVLSTQVNLVAGSNPTGDPANPVITNPSAYPEIVFTLVP
ncbi:hypothetical protein DRH13_00180 [Candidatus Woesebacteria bacterium]|nr:MAG: hypothetical protein DRH13_00180 [Candidatus Woesebacteria bacterium]